jgi:Fatty acid desaturase
MLGSANITESRAMDLMTGNLSHQIEHHLFPDLPSNRYSEIAPQVRALFEKYGLNYCARPLVPQVCSAWHRVVRLSLPNGWWRETPCDNLLLQLGTGAREGALRLVAARDLTGTAGPAEVRPWPRSHDFFEPEWAMETLLDWRSSESR